MQIVLYRLISSNLGTLQNYARQFTIFSKELAILTKGLSHFYYFFPIVRFNDTKI